MNYISARRFRIMFSVVLALLMILVSTGAIAGNKIVIKFAHVYYPGDSINDGVEYFCKLVSEKSGGRIECQNFGSGILGGDQELSESLGLGAVEMSVSGLAIMALKEPKAEMLEGIPFLWEDMSHLERFMDTDAASEILESFRKRTGIIATGTWYRGYRQLTTNKLVQTVEDLKGLKIRVPETKGYIAGWKALGTLTTPMSFTELYTALQQGTVAGQENPADLIFSSRLYEVQKYLIKTSHVPVVGIVFLSERWFSKIDKEAQDIILSCLRETDQYVDEIGPKNESACFDKLRDQGMQIIEPDVEGMREAVKDVPKLFVESLGQDFYERFMEDYERTKRI